MIDGVKILSSLQRGLLMVFEARGPILREMQQLPLAVNEVICLNETFSNQRQALRCVKFLNNQGVWKDLFFFFFVIVWLELLNYAAKSMCHNKAMK